MSNRASTTIDVRPIPPREKHSRIFAAFDGLKSGEILLLINDHDPTPLRYQFDFERARQFTWQPVQEGPLEWRIEIAKV